MKNSKQWIAIILIMILSNFKIMAQVDVTNHSWVAGYYVGWASNNNLDFKLGTTPTSYLTIDGTTNVGYVGIGTASPGQKLTVAGGHINVSTATRSYMINGSKVLSHNGDPTSIFVGVGAGASAPASGTLNNTFVGANSGTSITSTSANTLIGVDAGKSLIDNFHSNVAVGYQALYSDQHWGRNTAVGYKALYALNTACSSCDQGSNLNTAIGYEALTNSQAYGGCALGFWAGHDNTTGCSLVAIGEDAAYHNTRGNDNVAVGHDALNANTNLSNNVAIGTDALLSQAYSSTTSCPPDVNGNPTYGCVSSNNVAVGNASLFSNDPTTDDNGIDNTAIGNNSLYSNKTGAYNAACGFKAGYLNQTGRANVNIGYVAGYSNIASFQTFVGMGSGFYTTTGYQNCFVGYNAGYKNTTGTYNSVTGTLALYANTIGSYNIGLGYKAGYINTTGNNNTYVGSLADANAVNYSNSAAIGYGAITSASDKYVVGNTAVTFIGGQVGWTTISDGRFKINVTENVVGLDFIARLRPVTYTMNAQGLDAFLTQNVPPSMDSSGNVIPAPPKDFTSAENMVHSGFIAQEVEQASIVSGFASSIVSTPANSTDPYGLNYSEIVVPLVKAVQELDSIVKAQGAIIQSLQTAPSSNRMAPAPDNSTEQNQKEATAIDVTLSSKTIVLNQNSPNPFKESTVITYTIPENMKNVKIIFTDSRGNVLKEVAITQSGNGQLNVYAQDLSSGIYTYILVADGTTIDTKKMVCNK